MKSPKLPVRLFILWLVESLLAILLTRTNIASGAMPDGDDYLRLQQVRDLLGGQSWFDLYQHRFIPPVDAPMHWSRLVDVPIAATILALRPFLGQHSAEIAAAVIVPLVTMGCVMVAVALIARRLIGSRLALLAAGLVPFVPLLWVQLQPLRIDHHGWQIVAGLVIAASLLDRSPLRGGIIAGAASAIWLTISLEGLPFILAPGLVMMLPWLYDGRGAQRLQGFAVSLFATAAMLVLAMHATDLYVVRCDAFTLPYVAALAVVAAVIGAACSMPLATPLRWAIAVVAAVASLAIFLRVGPSCTTGPFAQLDPLVYRIWLRNVPEGEPLWRQTLPVAAMVVATPVFGLIGAMIGFSRSTAEHRSDWLILLWLQLAALLIAIAVQRAGAVANALALPGAVLLLSILFRAARSLSSSVARILATTAVVALMFPPALPAILIAATKEAKKTDQPQGDCSAPAIRAALSGIPPSNILSTLDLSSVIIATTAHRVLGTGHHRNGRGMRDVIIALMSPEQRAHEVIARRHIDYVVICGTASETQLFNRLAPHGFLHQLLAGRAPAWLVPATQKKQLFVWKIRGR